MSGQDKLSQVLMVINLYNLLIMTFFGENNGLMVFIYLFFGIFAVLFVIFCFIIVLLVNICWIMTNTKFTQKWKFAENVSSSEQIWRN